MKFFAAKKLILVLAGLLLAAVLIYYAARTYPAFQPVSDISGFERAARDLRVPWEVVFLPDVTVVSERPGTLALIEGGRVRERLAIEGVRAVGEGGLLGMAVHPDFPLNNSLYVYLTYQDDGRIKNRVEKYAFDGRTLSDRKVILDDIPGSGNHNGGRITFGPDKLLYVAAGDAGVSSAAQDTRQLAGKILRVGDNGQIPADNPFGNAVYSYGHRNVQGLAFDEQGNLWATEHGRSGVLSGFDELNLIEKGKNYGWPVIQGDERQAGMEAPVLHSGASKTWAPAGMVFHNGSLWFGGLRGQALYEAKIDGKKVVGFTERFVRQFGRIRAVGKDLENKLHITTSNTDGRGSPNDGDDQLIMVK